MHKKILVTGGAGFIGSNFIRYMLKTFDCTIVNLDALTYAGNLKNLEDIAQHKNYTFYQGSITDVRIVRELFERYNFDTVINFAAESHVDTSIQSPELFVITNVAGTQVLLEVAKAYWSVGVDDNGYPTYQSEARFIQISTDEVYGSLGKTGVFTEETPIAPNNPYAATKASADLLVKAYCHTYKFPGLITRCSNNYGPNQHHEKLIPKMISNALAYEELPVYGDGRQVRDWLHVEDHCTAIVAVLQKGSVGEVYNIGGNNEKTNIDLIKMVLNQLERPESLIVYVNDRLGHDFRYGMDSTKIRKMLGWIPQYTFEKGLSETIDWYQKDTNQR